MCVKTLTYNNQSMPTIYLPRSDQTKEPYAIRFADYEDVTKMIKRLRAKNYFKRPFRYLAVTEMGTKRGRPHVHILFFVKKEQGDTWNTCLQLERTMFKWVLHEWRRNYGSKRWPDYEPLCTYVRKWTKKGLSTNYDLHWCNPALTDSGVADVGFYVTKYMTKPSERAVRLQRALHLNLDEADYERIWAKVKPRFRASLGFGLNPVIDQKTSKILSISPTIKAYMRKCIEQTLKNGEEWPKFINPIDGKYFPLSRFYLRYAEIINSQDMTGYWFNRKDDNFDNLVIDERDRGQIMEKEQKFYRAIRPRIDSNSFNFDDLY